MYDWLIIGAGFTGSILAERIASQLDQRVLVIDRRAYPGGDSFDYVNKAGIRVQPYGLQFVHTASRRVQRYLSQFTDWRTYAHHVQADLDGRRIPLPFNLTSLQMLFPAEQAARLHRQLLCTFGIDARIGIRAMREQSSGELRRLAEFIFDRIVRPSAIKEWGLLPIDLPELVDRETVRVSFDARFSLDPFQAVPAGGFTPLFRRLLNHRNITLQLRTDRRTLPSDVRYRRAICTGPIDEFFEYAHGPLPWRARRLQIRTIPAARFQESAQVNCLGPEAWARIIEFSHAQGTQPARTTIAREFFGPHIPGKTEPSWPIPTAASRAPLALYRRDAAKLGDSVIFAGRLAEFENRDIAESVDHALYLFERAIAPGYKRVGPIPDAA
jgi:UDP-galactopyranose mutase